MGPPDKQYVVALWCAAIAAALVLTWVALFTDFRPANIARLQPADFGTAIDIYFGCGVILLGVAVVAAIHLGQSRQRNRRK
jgi:hypothetical protein